MPSLGQYLLVKSWLTTVLLRPLSTHLVGQYRLLRYHFDPVCPAVDQSKQSPPPALPSSRHFLLPMAFILVAQLYGVYGLDPQLPQWSDLLSRPFYATNRYIHYHQIVPRRSWKILEFLYFVTNASNIAILACLALGSKSSEQIRKRYRIVLGSGEDARSSSDSLLINRFQARAKRVLLLNSVFYYCYYLVFTSRNVALNGAFIWCFRHVLFWFAVIPLWTVYYIFITDALPINAIITVGIFRLKLKCLLRKFTALNLLIGSCQVKQQQQQQHQQQKTTAKQKIWWALYLRLNRRLLRLSKQLAAFAAFWNQPMSITFVVFIVKSCYEVFVLMVYGGRMAPAQIAFFLVFPVYFFALMVLYVAACSSVVKQYGLLRRETVRYAHLTIMQNFSGNGSGGEGEGEGGGVPLGQRLKVQWLAGHRRHLSYAFTLFGYYKISYNTFVELFSYISLLFLMMMERLSAEY